MKINYLKKNELKEIEVRCSSKNVYFNVPDLVKCLELNNIDEDEAVRRLCKILGQDISGVLSYADCYIKLPEMNELKESQDLKDVCVKESFDKLYDYIHSVLDAMPNKNNTTKEKLMKQFNYYLLESRKHIDAALEIQRKLLELYVEEKLK